ncbi:SH3 and multiple ankyrin repeat domains protein 3-like protein [Camelus ferus]|nr:SH3 and multiple ankyrin repeat domains protein 3-like protein [Camelus ferus]
MVLSLVLPAFLEEQTLGQKMSWKEASLVLLQGPAGWALCLSFCSRRRCRGDGGVLVAKRALGVSQWVVCSPRYVLLAAVVRGGGRRPDLGPAGELSLPVGQGEAATSSRGLQPPTPACVRPAFPALLGLGVVSFVSPALLAGSALRKHKGSLSSCLETFQTATAALWLIPVHRGHGRCWPRLLLGAGVPSSGAERQGLHWVLLAARLRLRDEARPAMPRSPTSSEDEMAQSFSDSSEDSDSDSSKEETIYDTIRATAEKPGGTRTEESQGNTLVVRIVIEDLQQTKCIRFNPDATVWVAKQRILCSLNQSLKDVLNYGLFQPASGGRDGKFLDEERLLREYPQPMGKGVPSLEFRYKKRVYKQSNLDEKQMAKLHTKTNLKKCMDHVQHQSVEKVVKMLERGLDPNFHDLESGGFCVLEAKAAGAAFQSPLVSGVEPCLRPPFDLHVTPRVTVIVLRVVGATLAALASAETPLTLAAQLDDPGEVIKALRNGGAHLDFRAKDGMTALHKAARTRNLPALKGISRTGQVSLVPEGTCAQRLHVSRTSFGVFQTLLELGASPDYKDSYGLTPLYHTAIVGGDPCCCELLLHEHAAVSCKDENGWHEIHQDSCARVLLFRGGNKELKNYNSQTPFQVAIIAGNFELAEYIKNHKETDVGE